MTVAELIAKLQQFDPNMEVKMELTSDYRDQYYPIEDHDIWEEEDYTHGRPAGKEVQHFVNICGSTL